MGRALFVRGASLSYAVLRVAAAPYGDDFRFGCLRC
jgi:hypothetical protein